MAFYGIGLFTSLLPSILNYSLLAMRGLHMY
ncbi:MAG: hypothetical protein JWN03_6641 [Nocardia sp.]|nr:hypothetical protein [Nocardia sp.]